MFPIRLAAAAALSLIGSAAASQTVVPVHTIWKDGESVATNPERPEGRQLPEPIGQGVQLVAVQPEPLELREARHGSRKRCQAVVSQVQGTERGEIAHAVGQ